jgi:hypothetical protein
VIGRYEIIEGLHYKQRLLHHIGPTHRSPFLLNANSMITESTLFSTNCSYGRNACQ